MGCVSGSSKMAWISSSMLHGGCEGVTQDRAGWIEVLGHGLPQRRGRCLSCFPREGQQPVPGTSTPRAVGRKGGVDQTISEGLSGKQSLVRPESSWQGLQRSGSGHIME